MLTHYISASDAVWQFRYQYVTKITCITFTEVDGIPLAPGNSLGAVWREMPLIDGLELYAATHVSITYGTTHAVNHDNTDEKFMVITYGAGDRESYGFPAKMLLGVTNGGTIARP